MSKLVLQYGEKFNYITVLKLIGTFNNKRKYECVCDCGKKIEVFGKYLKNGDTKSCGCKKGDILRYDLIGKKFGRLTVTKRCVENKKSNRWWCKCECGNEKSILANSLLLGKSKSCGCLHHENVKTWRQVKKYNDLIPYSYFNKIKINADKRNLEFNITIEDVWNIYLKQNKKCYFTKLDIGFYDKKYENGRFCSTASLDRIDSNKGYIKDNCCLVIKEINFMKQDFSVDDFIKYCKLVVENYE